MKGAVLLRKEVDVNFFCPNSYGFLVINNQGGPRLCTNSKSWFVKGTLDLNSKMITVDKGGYCPECGCIAQSRIQDKYDGCTVVVEG